jgi:16S rRNA processing protein RimM
MELLEIGRIIRSHGLAGHMKVLSYLESPNVLHRLSGVFVGREARDAAAFPLESVQATKAFLILKLGGIEDRDAVVGVTGFSVWMPSDRMAKLPPGEYYWSEIIGLQVVTEEGQVLGRIDAVFPTGSNDVYVCRKEGHEILIPAIGDVVRKIDTDQAIMVVRLLKGLTET